MAAEAAPLPRRARRTATRTAALVALVALLGPACSSEPQDPADEARDRVRDRLEATFTPAQARCIVDELDDATVTALAGTTALLADDDALASYSAAVVACVEAEG